MDVANEILDAIEIIVDKKIRENTAQIYPGVCKSVNGNTCVMSVNGRNNTVQFYGSTPTVGSTYRVFVPNGNMSMAFVITGNDERKGLYYSNPNLLDNSVFVDGNPVDQRQGRVVKPNTTYYSDNTLTTSAGTTSAYVTAYRYATGTASGVNYASFKLEDTDTAPTYYAAPENVVRGYIGAGYGIDRWYIDNANLTALIEDGYIKLIPTGATASAFRQLFEIFEAPYGHTVTLSVLTDSGLIKTTFDIPEKETITASKNYGLIEVEGYRYYLRINYGSGAITQARIDVYAIKGTTTPRSLYAAKLELGSQQTLAHQDENGNWVLNEIPDYGEQLARCQRYCLVLGNTNSKYECIGVGTSYSDTGVEILIPTPTSIRTFPTIAVTGNWLLRGAGGVVPFSAANAQVKCYQYSEGCIAVDIKLSGGLVAKQAYQLLRANNLTAKIIASADL